MKISRRLSPGRIIAGGFLCLILLGTLLLSLPLSLCKPEEGISFIDAFFTATSATCVTGLVVVPVVETFNVFGRTVIAILIQLGGLGVACFGATIILATGGRIGIKNRTLIREGWNLGTSHGLVRLLKMVLLVTLCSEAVGAVLSFPVFAQKMPAFDAIGVSIFHAISSFNNAGFDVLGGYSNLIPYQGNILLTLVTSFLIIFGGIGFFVIFDLFQKRSFKKLSLQAKIVLFMTLILLVGGTLLIKLTSELPWLDAFFLSVSARTAGFTTVDFSAVSTAALFVITVLMFIGASPGGTGGGIKTTTFFTLMASMKGVIKNQRRQAFKRLIPSDIIHKAFLLTLFALCTITLATFALCALEPQNPFFSNFFETVSAFGTVGLSTGITPTLSPASKLVLTCVMYIGRLGPLTAATLWVLKPLSQLSYSEETITIG